MPMNTSEIEHLKMLIDKGYGMNDCSMRMDRSRMWIRTHIEQFCGIDYKQKLRQNGIKNSKFSKSIATSWGKGYGV